ncbi:hypothetical protein [Pseudolabrys sp. FHR47]|uniref:hypothetical protein n=1 Tax=Pseudolabrys sp. FHR47 TaxID=2562284 RepID=UPI0010BECCA7|nr:hypothetical protein [Pseudolabrys sp. FHR47]
MNTVIGCAEQAWALIDGVTLDYPLSLSILMLITLGMAHFQPKRRRNYTWLLFVFVLGMFVWQVIGQIQSAPRIHLIEMIAATFVYAGMLFLTLCEILIAGLAARLTQWRSEKWVKELDYLYLGLAAVGLASSIDRLQIVSNKITISEVTGPFLLATALVIRTIKTRADIGGWAKNITSPKAAA